jgi:uncharacterized membrane protein (UPF0127 family)
LGENTYIPLDIAFVDKEGVIKNIEIITPLSRKSVQSTEKCKYAVETNLGFFEDHGIRVGDRILIEKDRDKKYLQL